MLGREPDVSWPGCQGLADLWSSYRGRTPTLEHTANSQGFPGPSLPMEATRTLGKACTLPTQGEWPPSVSAGREIAGNAGRHAAVTAAHQRMLPHWGVSHEGGQGREPRRAHHISSLWKNETDQAQQSWAVGRAGRAPRKAGPSEGAF